MAGGERDQPGHIGPSCTILLLPQPLPSIRKAKSHVPAPRGGCSAPLSSPNPCMPAWWLFWTDRETDRHPHWTSLEPSELKEPVPNLGCALRPDPVLLPGICAISLAAFGKRPLKIYIYMCVGMRKSFLGTLCQACCPSGWRKGGGSVGMGCSWAQAAYPQAVGGC